MLNWRCWGWLTNGERVEKSKTEKLETTKWGIKRAASSKSQLVDKRPSSRAIPTVQAPASALHALGRPNQARIPPIPSVVLPTWTTLYKPFVITCKPPQISQNTLPPTHHKPSSEPVISSEPSSKPVINLTYKWRLTYKWIYIFRWFQTGNERKWER